MVISPKVIQNGLDFISCAIDLTINFILISIIINASNILLFALFD